VVKCRNSSVNGMTDLELLSTFESRLNGTKQQIFHELVRRYNAEEVRLKPKQLAILLKIGNVRDALSELRHEFEQYCRANDYPDGSITRSYVEISLGNHTQLQIEDTPEARHLFWAAHRTVGPAITFSYTEALMFREREMRTLIRFLDVNGHEGDEQHAGSFLIRRSGGSYVARILTPGTKVAALRDLADSAAEKEIWVRQKDTTRLRPYRLWPFRGYVSAGETEFLLQISHSISHWAKARFARSHREQAFEMPADGTLIAMGNARTHITIRAALGWNKHTPYELDQPIYPFHHFPFRVDRNGIVRVRSNGSAPKLEYRKEDFSVRDDGCFSIYGLVSRMRAPGTHRPMTLVIGNHSAAFSAISRFLQDKVSMKALQNRMKPANTKASADEFPAEFQLLFEAAIRRNDESLVDDLPTIIGTSVATR
jgi:hypothetical protein